MIRTIALTLLALVSGCSGCASVSSFARLDSVALLIEMPNGSCSATAVGPHTLLTAGHCLLGGPVVAVNGQPVKVLTVEHDGNDHALVVVDASFDVWAEVGPRPILGERVRVLGNPRGFRRVYREGMVAAVNLLPECPEFTPTIRQRTGCVILLFQMSLGQGDSGAGYFDDQGRLVAVHSAAAPIAIADDGDWYATLPMALPLAFTDEQWRVAGV